jgi:hypothetical protein
MLGTSLPNEYLPCKNGTSTRRRGSWCVFWKVFSATKDTFLLGQKERGIRSRCDSKPERLKENQEEISLGKVVELVSWEVRKIVIWKVFNWVDYPKKRK